MVRQITRAWNRLAHPTRYRVRRKLREGRASGHFVELDQREFRAMFDDMTRRQFQMSATEFLKKMERGELPDTEMAEYLAQLAGGRTHR